MIKLGEFCLYSTKTHYNTQYILIHYNIILKDKELINILNKNQIKDAFNV